MEEQNNTNVGIEDLKGPYSFSTFSRSNEGDVVEIEGNKELIILTVEAWSGRMYNSSLNHYVQTIRRDENSANIIESRYKYEREQMDDFYRYKQKTLTYPKIESDYLGDFIDYAIASRQWSDHNALLFEEGE